MDQARQVLWYFIPGGVVIVSLLISVDDLHVDKGDIGGIVLLTPVLGYFVHQVWRAVFEATKMYCWKERESMVILYEDLPNCRYLPPKKERTEPSTSDLLGAYMIWELTFHSGRMPEKIWERNQKAWHYFQAFGGVAAGNLFAALAVWILMVLEFQMTHPWPVIVTNVIMLAISICKAILTYRFTGKSESSIYHYYREEFCSTIRKGEKGLAGQLRNSRRLQGGLKTPSGWKGRVA